jgi:radical SAM superfamily enzyme YgiQ (UPF0313 family)
MPARARSILYVRLPNWKIWPGGVVYVADWIHKQRPEIRQHLLDLALEPPALRKRALRERIEALRPDIVAFSWRNMQSFGPHPEDDALDVVMNYEFARTPGRRIRAAADALRIIYRYAANRLNNYAYFRLARRLLPEARIVVGGTAVSIFGRQVAEHCPPDSVVVVSEGEDAMLSIADGFEHPVGEFHYKDRNGRVSHHEREAEFPLAARTAVDFGYIESIFPRFRDYLDGDFGVNTKRGCPLHCHFCLYNQIEGSHQRYREPVEIVNEIEALHRNYGVTHFWFTDAQFCSTRQSTQHAEAILDEILARGLKIRWSGYLRLNFLTPALARKMLASGISSVDLSFTGSQDVINSLTLGYKLKQQMHAFRMLKEAGFTNQKVKLYIPLNAPGETADTLRETIARIDELYELFGRDNVLPFIFFIGIQPGTPVEQRLIEDGYLPEDYDPLTLNPFLIKKLLYNPEPLGSLIGRAYLEAVATSDPKSEYIGRATMDVLARELRSLPGAADASARDAQRESAPFPA